MKDQNNKLLFFAVVLGYLPFNISTASATSRNSKEQNSQEAREKVNRYM